MKLPTNKQALLEKEIIKKYGKDAIRNPKASWEQEELKNFRKEDIVREKERWNGLKREAEERKLDGETLISDSKTRAYKEDLTCPLCDKGEIVFTKSDYYFIFKHECCEKCYYLHCQ